MREVLGLSPCRLSEKTKKGINSQYKSMDKRENIKECVIMPNKF